ncbi:MAG: branched-chain amino acid transporter AzlD [Firmicutes bacterium HGW-Firmicutes-20]|jgi:branched-subunit amino acid transport protein AzlD|nr:MAG: branched-chain amino acid transporter AzlD [Firmicutes bacterium HGW-Firmicutes-20]PKM90534.1 MAG: branched-chain amino acid transporter AzlD [Firmicutes bacterium HGW-Firmicutes-10]
MNSNQMLITVGMLVAGTVFTRFLPFIAFPEHKPIPKVITYLGQRLPYATMGMLVVYALKDTKITQSPYGLYELLSLVVIAIVHHFKNNTLLSISAGVIVYLILVNGWL